MSRGIGPEVALGALVRRAVEDAYHGVVFGDVGLARERARCVGIDPDRIVAVANPTEARQLLGRRSPVVQVGEPLEHAERQPGRWTRAGGAAQLTWSTRPPIACLQGAQPPW